MLDVAILGAGEIGGSLAYVLARRDFVRSIRLIDAKGQVAAGKALDIAQVAPIEGFTVKVSGAVDVAAAGGADIVVVADRAAGGEWSGDEAALLLKQLSRIVPRRLVLCAGSSHAALVTLGVEQLEYRRSLLAGTAPEALAAAIRALVALQTGASVGEVALTVLGMPPARTVVPWEDVTVAGAPISRLLDEPTRRKLAAQVAPLWPPGPYALATAASEVIAAAAGRTRRSCSLFVAAEGAASRTVALPARTGVEGIATFAIPALSPNAQVALDNAMKM